MNTTNWMPNHLRLPLLVLWCAAQGLALPSAHAATSSADSNVTAVDTRDNTLTVSGRVRAATNSAAISGAAVLLGGQNTTTADDGTFTLSGVVLASGNTLTVSKSGFMTDTETPSIPAGSESITLADILLQATNGSLPVVTGLKPKYDGLFLSAVSFLNDYTCSVNWNGRTPGSVEFYVNGALNKTVNTATAEATATLDMALGFNASLTLGANKVKVVAVSGDGTRSQPYEQSVTIIPPPTGLDLLSLPFELVPGNDPAIRFKVQVPPVGFPASAVIPIQWFDKIGLKLSGIAEMKYRILGGQWDLRAGLRSEAPKLSWGGWTPTFEFTPEAKGVASQTRGFVIDRVGLKLRLDGKYPILVVYAFDLVPGGQILRVADVLVLIGVDVNSIQRLQVNGLFRLDADLLWNCQSHQFQDATITPGGGVEALYEPNPFGSSLRVDITGRLNFPIRLTQPVAWKATGEVSFGLRAEVWGIVLADSRWIVLSGDIASSGNWAGQQRIVLRAVAPDGSVVAVEGVLLSAVSACPRPAERDYLSAGPEVFVAGESNQKLVAGDAVSALANFRQLSQAPVKGSVMLDAVDLSKSGAGAYSAKFGEPGSGTNQADLTLVQNAFPGSSPAMAARGTELMLLYVTDNGITNNLQYTDIAWTRWDGTNWSVPLGIRTNTQAEFAPQVAYDGNGDAIAVWERVADPNFNETNLTAMAAQMEIVWSRWVRSSGAWSEPAALTANSYLDHAPLLCGPMASGNVLAVWTKNAANLLIGTNAPGNDTVLWAEWSAASRMWGAPQVLVDGLAYRLSQSLAGVGNHAVYAWTRDADGVLTNDADQEVFFMEYTNSAWEVPRQLTTNAVADKTVRAAVATNGTAFLVWQSGTNLVLSQNFSTNLSIARADSQTAGFADYAMTVGPLGHLVLLWQEMSTNGSDAHYMVYDPVAATWGLDDLLCHDLPLERSFAPVWDAVGNLAVAYDKVQILYTNKTVTVEGGGTVTITNVPQPGRVDLVVTKRALVKDLALLAGDFTVQGVNYLPGDPLTLSATVHNSGNVAVSNVVVGFYDGNPDAGGVLLTNVALAGWLVAAGTNVASAVWVVTEPATNHTLYAVANRAVLAGEFNGSNNVAKVSIGGTDLSVSLSSYSAETNGAMRVIAQVQNLGAPSATNSVLAIRRQGQTNAPLATVPVPMLEPGRLAQVALDLPAGTQPAGEQIYTLTADETHVTGDIDTNNNTTSFAANLWIDSDGDGTPDSWMMQYFGHATGQAGDLSRAQDDADGDGVSNLAEYLAGTDPKDPHSYLSITGIGLGGTNGVQVAWGSASNKLYSLQRALALSGGLGFTNIAEHILSTPPQNVYVDATATNSPSLFYRVRVE